MLKAVSIAMLLLAAGCTDSGSWLAMIGFALAALIAFMADRWIAWRRKAFKDAVEREVNRRIYHYKKMG